MGGEPALRNYVEEFCSLLYAKIRGASAGPGWFIKDSASVRRWNSCFITVTSRAANANLRAAGTRHYKISQRLTHAEIVAERVCSI